MANPPVRRTLLSKLPNFDPSKVPVLAIDSHLPAVPGSELSPEALRRRFHAPPQWVPEIIFEYGCIPHETAAASVLVPVVMRERPTILLTERTSHLSSHSGQVAFPGGKRDKTDTDAAHTALREADEEIGLGSHLVEVIGHLPTYTTGTQFVVTPVVGLVNAQHRLMLNTNEVADAFEVPLDFLMNPAHHRHHAVEVDGEHRKWISMSYMEGGTERLVWGATAAMLRNLYRFLSA